jgi:hypothetical protein
MAYRLARAYLFVVAAAVLGARSQTTRLGEDAAPAKVASSGMGIAILRLGTASPTCRHVGVWLGVPEGRGYRPHKPVAIIHAGSLADIPVAEVELSPGEYHVISYACGTGSDAKQVVDFDTITGLARSSHASFSIAAGEVVNVGSFEFHAARVGTNAFGRPVKTTVSVTDWPLGDLERYRQRRPQLYAQMKTRLMTVTARTPGQPGESTCAEVRRLKAEGKLQNVPEACAEAAPAASAQPAAVAARR